MRLTSPLTAMAFLVAGLMALQQAVGAQEVVLTGATVYDGTGGPPLGDAVVHIEGGRIACVGRAGDCPVPQGAETVDLAGRFVAPGLVDAHVHHVQTGWLDGRPDHGVGTDHYDYAALQRALSANPDRWHRAYLCSGITAVYDVGGLPWTLDLEATSERDTERAHVRAAGPLITAHEPVFAIFEMDGVNAFLSMESDEQAFASVRRLAEMGARAVKVWYIDAPEDQREARAARLIRIGEEARARGLPLVVHATELRNAKAALRAGAAMLVHSVWDQPIDEEFIRLARQAETVYTPTLTVVGNWARAHAAVTGGVVVPLDDPNGCVDAETRRAIAEAPVLHGMVPEDHEDPSWMAKRGSMFATMIANLEQVYRAGVQIATGTDAGNPLTVHGPSIYGEMEAMESAGISPSDVLVMSTRNGAAAMGRLEDFGTIEVGKLADLVVLTEDPGASTRAFRSIIHVMRGGVLHTVAELAAP